MSGCCLSWVFFSGVSLSLQTRLIGWHRIWAAFCNPSSFNRSSHVRLLPVILSEVCSSLLPWRLWLMSSISSILNVLLRESAWLAETSCIASFTCEPCAIVLCRPPSYLPFSGEASHTYFFRRKVSASRILQVPGSLFLEFFQKLFAVCRASNKNFSKPRGEIIR